MPSILACVLSAKVQTPLALVVAWPNLTWVPLASVRAVGLGELVAHACLGLDRDGFGLAACALFDVNRLCDLVFTGANEKFVFLNHDDLPSLSLSSGMVGCVVKC